VRPSPCKLSLWLAAFVAMLGVGCRPAAPTTPVAQATTHAPVAGAWDLLRTRLPGTYAAGEGDARIEIELRLVSRDSALVQTWRTRSGETTSVAHPDREHVLLTHYCAQGNAARLRLVAADDQHVAFEFLDATNLRDSSVMVRLEWRFTADGYEEVSTYRAPNGALASDTTRFVRTVARSH
jgi:hypothetical protein